MQSGNKRSHNRVKLDLGIVSGGMLYRWENRIYVDKYIQNKTTYDILYPEIKQTLLPEGYAMFTNYWNMITGWTEDIYVKIPDNHICKCSLNMQSPMPAPRNKYIMCGHCLQWIMEE